MAGTDRRRVQTKKVDKTPSVTEAEELLRKCGAGDVAVEFIMNEYMIVHAIRFKYKRK